MSLIRNFVVLALLLLQVNAIAQVKQKFAPGYILLSDGSRLEGYLKTSGEGLNDAILFKTQLADSAQLYVAGDIAGYGLSGGVFQKTYKNQGVSTRWVFLEPLIEGEMSAFVKNNMIFIKKSGSDEFVHVPKTVRKLRRVLATLTRDCPYAMDRTYKAVYSKASLINVVSAYNDCIANPEKKYLGIPKQFQASLLLGCEYSPARFENQHDPTTTFLAVRNLKDLSLFTGGVNFTFRNYNRSTITGLYTGIYFNSTKYSQINVNSDFDATEYNEFTLDMKEIKIPIGLEFRYPSIKKIQLSCKTGLAYAKVVNYSFERVEYQDDPVTKVTNRQVSAGLTHPNKNIQFQLGLCLQRVVTKGIKFRLEGIYGQGIISANVGFQNNKPVTARGTFQSFSILGGIVF